MTLEKWIIHPGETRVIDIETVRSLKVGLIGGQIDVIAHDEPGARIEVHGVTIKDLRIEVTGDAVEIDHPQLRWDNFLEVFRNFGTTGPKAEISVAVPRSVALNLGVVSASALVSGIRNDARLNTVSGDIIVDGLKGDLTVNAVSGDIQIRELVGALGANSVSGDVAATGSIRKATIDTVSGAMLVDSTGDLYSVSLNTVSGSSTVRLDEGYPANFVVRSVSGKAQLDGVVRSGKGNGPMTNFSGSAGELAGAFADIRVNSVSGDITVLRRAVAAPDAASAVTAESDTGLRRGGVVMTPVFSHGDLRLYLLNLLDEGPRHGYDIMQALSDRTGGTYTPSAGTVYPRLAKLEEEGLVTKSVDGRKTVYEITDAGRAEVAARAGDLEGIEASLTDSVRLIADEVRGSVREAMRSLRADLAAASREERASATYAPPTDDPRVEQSRAGAPGGCRGQRVPRQDPSGPALPRGARRRARGVRRRRSHDGARTSLARDHPHAARLSRTARQVVRPARSPRRPARDPRAGRRGSAGADGAPAAPRPSR